MGRKNRAAVAAVDTSTPAPIETPVVSAPIPLTEEQQEELQQAAIEMANIQNDELPVRAARTGKRLVKRTNVPWRRKYYYLDPERYAETEEVRKTKAAQIQLMLKYMAEAGITDAEVSQQGDTICSAAIASGYVKSKINPPVLFAYYRKDMEALGLVFAGYNMDH